MFVFMACVSGAFLEAQHLKQSQWCENIENHPLPDLYDGIFLFSAMITTACAHDVWTHSPNSVGNKSDKLRRLAAAGSVTTLLGLAKITHYFLSTDGFDKH